VRARAEHKVADLRAAAITDGGRPRPALVLVTVAAVAGLGALVWWRRQH